MTPDFTRIPYGFDEFPRATFAQWQQAAGPVEPRQKITKANVRLGGAGSYAIPATETEKPLVGRELTDEVIAAAGAAAMKPAPTMDNTDLDVCWRRKVAPVFVARALMACQ